MAQLHDLLLPLREPRAHPVDRSTGGCDDDQQHGGDPELEAEADTPGG
jgi:hypothetical protein